MKKCTSCESMWDQLSAYVDGMLPPDKARHIEEHVAGCSSCAMDLRFLRNTAAMLSDMPAIDPPLTLRQSILNATIYRTNWRNRLYAATANAIKPYRVRTLALAGVSLAILAVALTHAFYQPATNRIAQLPGSSHITPWSSEPAYPGNFAKPSNVTANSGIVATAKHPQTSALAGSSKLHKITNPIRRRMPVETQIAWNYAPQEHAAAHKRYSNTGLIPRRVEPSMTPDADTPPTGEPDRVAMALPVETNANVVTGIISTGKNSAEAPSADNHIRLHLVEATPPVNTNTVSTLSDLRRSIRARQATVIHDGVGSFSSPGNHHDVMFDLIKSRF